MVPERNIETDTYKQCLNSKAVSVLKIKSIAAECFELIHCNEWRTYILLMGVQMKTVSKVLRNMNFQMSIFSILNKISTLIAKVKQRQYDDASKYSERAVTWKGGRYIPEGSHLPRGTCTYGLFCLYFCQNFKLRSVRHD
jgi:hypothetical protein